MSICYVLREVNGREEVTPGLLTRFLASPVPRV